jgi:hypothetical protein
VDADEYVSFLEKGFKLVFGNLMAADKLTLPPLWPPELKQAKCLTPLPEVRCIDLITGIFWDKIAKDKVLRGKQHAHLGQIAKMAADGISAANGVMSMQAYVLEHFSKTFGSGAACRKQFKAFVLALVILVEDKSSPWHELALLFAQMAGVHTPSGRVTALPHEAAEFLLLHLDGVQVTTLLGRPLLFWIIVLS